MHPGCLTEDEEKVLRDIAKRDLTHWAWFTWVRMCGNNGKCWLHHSWVMLCYRVDKVMPQVRRDLNRIYMEECKRIAAEYGFEIELDLETQRLLMFDPARYTAEEAMKKKRGD